MSVVIPTIFNGNLFVDDRGALTVANGFDFRDVKRFYMVENHERGFIRAWHGHEKEGKYVFVVSGAIKIALMPLNSNDVKDMQWFVLSDKKPMIFGIPPGCYNGFMTLQENTKVMFFSTSTLEESNGDDIRKEYDHFGEDVWKITRR